MSHKHNFVELPSSPWWKEPIFCKASGATGCAILRRTW